MTVLVKRRVSRHPQILLVCTLVCCFATHSGEHADAEHFAQKTALLQQHAMQKAKLRELAHTKRLQWQQAPTVTLRAAMMLTLKFSQALHVLPIADFAHLASA